MKAPGHCRNALAVGLLNVSCKLKIQERKSVSQCSPRRTFRIDSVSSLAVGIATVVSEPQMQDQHLTLPHNGDQLCI